jgi:hypothetical protein
LDGSQAVVELRNKKRKNIWFFFLSIVATNIVVQFTEQRLYPLNIFHVKT